LVALIARQTKRNKHLRSGTGARFTVTFPHFKLNTRSLTHLTRLASQLTFFNSTHNNSITIMAASNNTPQSQRATSNATQAKSPNRANK
jgi:hypothetical protein